MHVSCHRIIKSDPYEKSWQQQEKPRGLGLFADNCVPDKKDFNIDKNAMTVSKHLKRTFFRFDDQFLPYVTNLIKSSDKHNLF